MNPFEIPVGDEQLPEHPEYKAIYIQREDGDYDLVAVVSALKMFLIGTIVDELNESGETCVIRPVGDLSELTDVLEEPPV